MITNWDWGKVLPKTIKRLSSTIKDFKNRSFLKVTHNLNYEWRKNFELIPVKSYKKDIVFPVAKTLKDNTNRCLKLAKALPQ